MWLYNPQKPQIEESPADLIDNTNFQKFGWKLYIFFFYKNKHVYANSMKIDKRVLKLWNQMFFLMGFNTIELVIG